MIGYNRSQDALIDKMGYYLSEASMYGKFIRYKKLDEIFKTYMPNMPMELNVFIDMTPIIMPVYKFDNIGNPFGILACMINFALHYRHYFNKLNRKSNIFLIYSSNDSANNYKYIASYDYKHKLLKDTNSTVNEMINHNIELLSTLIPYFPGIYLKRGTVEPTVIAYDLIDKFTRNGNLQVNNIFISSGEYAYQLPAVLGNVLLIMKKKAVIDNKSDDISYGVVKSNALSTYINMKAKSPIKLEDIAQTWISPFFILNGLSSRDIRSLLSYNQALKVLYMITSSYQVITPDSIYDAMINLNMNKVSKEELYSRYYALDIDYQLKLYRQIPESLESNFLTDIYDQKALYDIINSYFPNSNSIDLQKI